MVGGTGGYGKIGVVVFKEGIELTLSSALRVGY